MVKNWMSEFSGEDHCWPYAYCDKRKCENPSRDRVSGLSSQDETETVMLLNYLFPTD